MRKLLVMKPGRPRRLVIKKVPVRRLPKRPVPHIPDRIRPVPVIQP